MFPRCSLPIPPVDGLRLSRLTARLRNGIAIAVAFPIYLTSYSKASTIGYDRAARTEPAYRDPNTGLPPVALCSENAMNLTPSRDTREMLILS